MLTYLEIKIAVPVAEVAMGEGGQNVSNAHSGRAISWEEVQKHVHRNDKWIVINNQVYDVTAWSLKHPGGSRVINHYAGQDASVSISTVNYFTTSSHFLPLST